MEEENQHKKDSQSSITNSHWGRHFSVVHPVNIYGASFGDDCFVGPFVEIQSSVVIGSRVRIQSHSFLCSNVSLGDDVFVGHGVMFINDKFSDGSRAHGNQTKLGSTIVGQGVLIGSNTTILPVKICKGAVIGAGSVVTKDIEIPGVYVGNPAKLLHADEWVG